MLIFFRTKQSTWYIDLDTITLSNTYPCLYESVADCLRVFTFYHEILVPESSVDGYENKMEMRNAHGSGMPPQYVVINEIIADNVLLQLDK